MQVRKFADKAWQHFTRSRNRTAFIIGVSLCSTVLLANGCLSHSLTGLKIEPAAGKTQVIPGVSAQFKAIGIYTESGHQTTEEDLTDQVQWSTTIPAVATVNASGLVTGINPGLTSVMASIKGTFGNLTATSDVTVSTPSGGGSTGSRALKAVTIVPANQTLGSGQTGQLLAFATYSASPTSENVTDTAAWNSSDTAVATVSSSGLVKAGGAGTATITAVTTGPDGSALQGSCTITVTSAATTGGRTLTAIAVTPGAQTLSTAGQTAQLLAVGSYSASPTSANLTTSASWQSSDTSVATVNSTGVVTAVGPGSATITAVGTASDGSVVTGSATITVTSAAPSTRTLLSLSVIPTTQSVTQTGETSQFLAIGTYSAAPLTEDLTNQVQWVSSDQLVATVNNAGLATTVGLGESSITALATNPDGSVVSATGILQSAAGTGTTTLPTLAIYGAGAGSGTVTGTVTLPDGSTGTPVSCTYTGPPDGVGAGSNSTGCSASIQKGSTVTLTASPASTSVFGGWSSNCASATSDSCTITLSGNDSVGAIFDLK